MAICGSFQHAQAVSVERNKATDCWELYVSWIPHPSEIDCIEKIVAKYGSEMVTSNGRTVFRLKQKPIDSPF